MTVDAVKNRKLFYWFVESQRNPAQDPLLVWLNGGAPNHPSLLFSFFFASSLLCVCGGARARACVQDPARRR